MHQPPTNLNILIPQYDINLVSTWSQLSFLLVLFTSSLYPYYPWINFI